MQRIALYMFVIPDIYYTATLFLTINEPIKAKRPSIKPHTIPTTGPMISMASRGWVGKKG